MPLTDDLGNECLAQLSPATRDSAFLPSRFAGGTFEGYLSLLASDQPHLTVTENLANRALFHDFSSAIGAVLERHQLLAMDGPAPGWLSDFLSYAHATRAGILSFNYDTLLECLVDSPGGLLQHPTEHRRPNFWWYLTGDQPPLPPGTTSHRPPVVETLELLKLHGSTNWYWTPGDTTGATVARRGLLGQFGTPIPYDDEERRRNLPGRVPLVVPPTATKSDFYSTPLIREAWQRARSLLERATRVHLLGYSIPPTDFTTNFLLQHALQRTSTDVVISDLHPAPIAKRLGTLGIEPGRITTVTGPESIASHVEAMIAERSLGVLREVAQGPDEPERQLIAAWGNAAFAGITELREEDGRLMLVTELPVREIAYAARSRAPSDQSLLTTRALARLGKRPLFIEVPGHAPHPVAATVPHAMNVGSGDGRWQIVISSRGYVGQPW